MKQAFIVLTILIGIVGAAWWIYQRSIAPEGEREVLLVIDEVQGDAHRIGRNHNTPLKRKEILNEGQAVATGDNGRLTLSLGESATIELEENSTFRVQKVSEREADFMLVQGGLKAQVTRFPSRPARKVGVSFKGNPSKVSTEDASLRVRTNGEGRFAAAVERGHARLERPDKDPLPLPAGTQILVGDQGDLLSSGTIPRSVLLKIDWPEDPLIRGKSITLRGEASPVADLSVAGQSFQPNEDGTFEVTIPLEEGENRFDVRVRDLVGDATFQSPVIIRDTRPPVVQSETTDIWSP